MKTPIAAVARALRCCGCQTVLCVLLLYGVIFTGIDAGAAASVTPAAPSHPSDTSPLPPELREEWTGQIYASTFRVGICIAADGNARGVLLLSVPTTGKVDVYHFYGQQGKDGTITLSHPSGHRFTGRFTSGETVEGRVKLKNGFRVTLRADRQHDAPLSADTCRPVDTSVSVRP